MIDLQGEYTDYDCRLAQITEKKTSPKYLQSHDAIRTFIVTALNEGIDTNAIALITSHSDIKVMIPSLKLRNSVFKKIGSQ